MGVIGIVPIVGQLNLMGWMKACFQARKKGEKELPRPSFEYVMDGVWLIVAMLPIAGALLVVNLGGLLFAAILPGFLKTLFNLGFGLVTFALAVAAAVLSPAAMYLHLSEGERWAGARFMRLVEIAKHNVNVYLMLWVALFVAGIVQSLGFFACGVGMLLTVPFALAVQGFSFADFDVEKDRMVEISSGSAMPFGEPED